MSHRKISPSGKARFAGCRHADKASRRAARMGGGAGRRALRMEPLEERLALSPAPFFSLAEKQSFATGTTPRSVSIGDLNADGNLDLVAANLNSLRTLTASVLTNKTAGGASIFDFAPKQDFATGSMPIATSLGDINGDGLPDLVVCNLESNTVSVLLNTTTAGAATPSLALAQDFPVGLSPYAAALGDINGDGKLDIVVVDSSSSIVSVLLNTTPTDALAPSFAAKQDFGTGMRPKALCLGDLNGDGKLDLTVANTDSNSLSVLLNTTLSGATKATFAAKQDFATGSAPSAVSIGDLNGDGQLDLAVTNQSSDSVSVFLNTTAGAATASFTPRQDYATGAMPISVAIGDVNRDQRPDLVVANLDSNTVSVLLSATRTWSAAASFAAKLDFPTGARPYSIALGDLNGDGKLEVVTADTGASTLSVLLNTTVPLTVPMVNATDAGGVYKGAPFAVTAATVTGAIADGTLARFGDAALSYSYYTGSTYTGSAPLSGPPQNVGLYTVVAHYDGDNSNYTSADSLPVTFSIVPTLTSVGLYDPAASTFYLKCAAREGIADLTFGFGVPHWTPLVGDWNGDGCDTIGLFQPEAAHFYLRNSNSSGMADLSFGYGDPAQSSQYVILMGDWNGDGIDTIGLYHRASATWFLRNTNTEGQADIACGFGVPGSNWIPLAGDWNGDGRDTIGLYDPTASTFYLRNSPTTGMADIAFPYGAIGGNWTPLVGDWNGDCTESAGFYQAGAASHFYLRNAFTPGSADVDFGLGFAGCQPLAGNWLGSTGQALQADSAIAASASLALLADPLSVSPLLDAARARWAAAGVTIAAPQVLLTELPGTELERAVGNTIYLDRGAAGHGWFVDSTPAADEEFELQGGGTTLRAVDARAIDRIDLLTVVEHELGHLAGLPDLAASLNSLMSGTLPVGVRRGVQ